VRREFPDVAHLALFTEVPDGPLQRDEALLLHALVRVTRPRTIVEIGFLRGRSAFNFLRSLDADGRLYSFDIDPESAPRADELSRVDGRLVFRNRSQDAITPEDVDGRTVDLVFLDASHDLALNQATFERLLPLMAPNAILAIHDTGTIPRALVPPGHWWFETPEGWLGDEREVLPDERAFVNWLLERHGDFSQLHFHSHRTLRCGLTLLQRSGPLPRSGG
jgi:predicted O-methyltransferase YrrM